MQASESNENDLSHFILITAHICWSNVAITEHQTSNQAFQKKLGLVLCTSLYGCNFRELYRKFVTDILFLQEGCHQTRSKGSNILISALMKQSVKILKTCKMSYATSQRIHYTEKYKNKSIVWQLHKLNQVKIQPTLTSSRPEIPTGLNRCLAFHSFHQCAKRIYDKSSVFTSLKKSATTSVNNLGNLRTTYEPSSQLR